jgi:hypothetical protein
MPEKPRPASAVKRRRLARQMPARLRRLLTETELADALGIPLATVRHLVAIGRLPKPLEEFNRYDMEAIDDALDRMSGLGGPTSALDNFRARRHASAR